MRYWKGAYDEDCVREAKLRRRAGLVTETVASDDRRALGIFHALVALQVLMVVGAVLLSLVELLAGSR